MDVLVGQKREGSSEISSTWKSGSFRILVEVLCKSGSLGKFITFCKFASSKRSGGLSEKHIQLIYTTRTATVAAESNL